MTFYTDWTPSTCIQLCITLPANRCRCKLLSRPITSTETIAQHRNSNLQAPFRGPQCIYSSLFPSSFRPVSKQKQYFRPPTAKLTKRYSMYFHSTEWEVVTINLPGSSTNSASWPLLRLQTQAISQYGTVHRLLAVNSFTSSTKL